MHIRARAATLVYVVHDSSSTPYPRTHTCIYVHTYACTYVHTYACIYVHKYAYPRTRTCIDVDEYAVVRMCSLTIECVLLL